MKAENFRNRTKEFALAIIKFYGELPKKTEVKILGNQLLRSGTSIAANYREACRARSRAEFISKIEICIQEADETQLWLELLKEGCNIATPHQMFLESEVNELISIMVAMSKNAKSRSQK